MNATERTRARAHTYALFGQIFRHGLTKALFDYSRHIDPLAQALPSTCDPDEAAAAHYHLFGLNVFPYQSVFLDSQAMMGGPSSAAVAEFYVRAGFDAATQNEAPDHIGIELALLASLCAAESQALENGQLTHAQRVRNVQRAFLDQHLLVWLPALVQAIRQQNAPFYATLAELTLELALDHRRDMGDASQALHLSSSPTLSSISASSLLEDPKTGLREIAAYLLVPASSGFYLSRDDIRRLSRQGKLPSGFGDRRVMLTNLMRSAITYDHFARLMRDLDELAEAWQAMYGDLSSALPTIAAMWRVRLSETRTLLQTIKAQQPDPHRP